MLLCCCAAWGSLYLSTTHHLRLPSTCSCSCPCLCPCSCPCPCSCLCLCLCSNHEAEDDSSFSHYLARLAGLGLGAGANSGTNTPLYYSFDDHLVHWVGLDTEMWPYNAPAADINAMLTWLEADLKAVNRTRTPWVFFFGHRGPWMDGANFTGVFPLLQQYHVEIAFLGHEHQYQRLLPIDQDMNSHKKVSGASTAAVACSIALLLVTASDTVSRSASVLLIHALQCVSSDLNTYTSCNYTVSHCGG